MTRKPIPWLNRLPIPAEYPKTLDDWLVSDHFERALRGGYAVPLFWRLSGKNYSKLTPSVIQQLKARAVEMDDRMFEASIAAETTGSDYAISVLRIHRRWRSEMQDALLAARTRAAEAAGERGNKITEKP